MSSDAQVRILSLSNSFFFFAFLYLPYLFLRVLYSFCLSLFCVLSCFGKVLTAISSSMRVCVCVCILWLRIETAGRTRLHHIMAMAIRKQQ